MTGGKAIVHQAQPELEKPAALSGAAVLQRFEWLRLPLILWVIVAHAYTPGGWVSPLPADSPGFFVLNLISGVWGRNTVSLLFIISGYLFFRSYSPGWQPYRGKLSRRVRSLVIPYLFWNLANLIFLFALQSLPWTSGQLTGSRALVVQYGWFEYLDAFLGLSGYPVAYPFWFIRDLILLVVLTPVFYWLARRLPWITALGLYVWWFVNPDTVVVLGPRALLCFYLGALWAVQSVEMGWVDRWRGWVIGAYLLVSLADGLLWTEIMALHHLSMTLGVLCFWALAGMLQGYAKLSAALQYWAAGSFFIFAVHEPLLTILDRLLQVLLPPLSDWQLVLRFVLVIVLTSALSMLAWLVSRRIAPRFTSLVSGGRAA